MVLATALHTNFKQKNVLSIDRTSDSVFLWRGGITPKKGIRCAGLPCLSTDTQPAQGSSLFGRHSILPQLSSKGDFSFHNTFYRTKDHLRPRNPYITTTSSLN